MHWTALLFWTAHLTSATAPRGQVLKYHIMEQCGAALAIEVL